MKFHFIDHANKEENLLLLVNKTLQISSALLDSETIRNISDYIKDKKVEYKKNKIISFNPLGNKQVLSKILLLMYDEDENNEELNYQHIGNKIFSVVESHHIDKLVIDCSFSTNNVTKCANILYGIKLSSYSFKKYKTDDKQNNSISIVINNEEYKHISNTYDQLEKIADGIKLARDLVTEPPNHLYPESYANICKDDLTKLGVSVRVLGEEEMRQLSMGAILGVGQGSYYESKIVVMEWNGSGDSEFNEPLAFVGKGVTFDSGGISLKPASGMEKMKYDMAGSAAVVGLIKALAGRKAKVNAVGVIGLTENMPGSKAQRPSDIVKSMSGQTIEVINTDAEGRLVLADLLWYTQETYCPKFVINLATLTGAIVVALGRENAGIFSNNQHLTQKLTDAGHVTDEKVWELPMSEDYAKLIESKVADIKNISNANTGAGSIVAAEFLRKFIKRDTAWIHIDIAGVAWRNDNKKPLYPEGASGFGVKLLNKLVEKYYE